MPEQIGDHLALPGCRGSELITEHLQQASVLALRARRAGHWCTLGCELLWVVVSLVEHVF
jgi:hypothetical protein